MSSFTEHIPCPHSEDFQAVILCPRLCPWRNCLTGWLKDWKTCMQNCSASTRCLFYLMTITFPKITVIVVISRCISTRRRDLGITLKADGTGKGSGLEAGHSKAGVVFLSQGPTLQEPGEGLGKEGGDMVGWWWWYGSSPPASGPSLPGERPSPLVESAPWRRSKSPTGFAMNEKLQPSARPSQAPAGLPPTSLLAERESVCVVDVRFR